MPLTGGAGLDQVAARLARPLHLLITSFDYDRNRARFFRSSVTSQPQWGMGEAANVLLAEAIHASSNAPVNYFDEPAKFPGRPERFWDGGIAACNNPVLAAVAEAVGRGQNPADIRVLSIGAGSVVLPPLQPGQFSSPFVQAPVDQGFFTDLRKLAEAVVDDPPDIATFLAHVMTGSGAGITQPADSRVVRMNPLISPVQTAQGWAAPGGMDPKDFTSLTKLGLDAIEQKDAMAISNYADLWIRNVAPNQPIRMDGTTLKCELGQAWFRDALAAWNAIRV